MSKSLTQRLEFQLNSSALYDSNIITLPPVASTVGQPPLALTATLMLPCEPRFFVRLVDHPDTGRSRWTTPEAARDAEMGSRIYPPYHPSARSVRSALDAMVAHEAVTRSIQQDLSRQAEAQRRVERERTRPAYIIADAANGTASEQSTMPTSPGDAGNDGKELTMGVSNGDDEEIAFEGAQQEDQEGEEHEDDDGAAGKIDPDSMPLVGASCQRCIDNKTQCNRRRPCQFCLRDDVLEGGCFFARDPDSPEAISIPGQTTIQRPYGPQATAPVDLDARMTRGPGRNKNKRPKMVNFPSPPHPRAPISAPATALTPSFPSPNTATVSSSAAPAVQVVHTPPPAPSTLANSYSEKPKGGRKRKLSSPPPPRTNFPTDEEKKRFVDWLERHKND